MIMPYCFVEAVVAVLVAIDLQGLCDTLRGVSKCISEEIPPRSTK